MAALAAWAALAGWTGDARAAAEASPIGAHSMIQLTDPPSFMATMFSQAAAMGASTIRLDVVSPATLFSGHLGLPDFSGLDEVMSLAEQYHLRVVDNLMGIPSWLADCRRQPIRRTPSAAAPTTSATTRC